MSVTQPLLGPLAGARADSRDGFAERFASALGKQRPLIVLGALIAISWAVLVAMLWGSSSSVHPAATPWWCMVDMGSATSRKGLAGSVLSGMPMWSLMTAAMMLPACAPAVRRTWQISSASPGRAAFTFTSIYLLVWLAFGVVALSARAVWPTSSRAALIAALVIAVAWQLTAHKRRALEACSRVPAPDPVGRRVALGSARRGLRAGVACLASCWAIMLAMAMVATSQLAWVVGLTLLICLERLPGEPRRASRGAAAILAVLVLDLTFAVLV